MRSQEIEAIKKEIFELGQVLPGKMTEQYNVCGTPNCKCKRKKNPEKHGPYHYLSFTFNGKSTTWGIPKDKVEEIRKLNNEYNKFRELNKRLVECNMADIKENILKRPPRKKGDK